MMSNFVRNVDAPEAAITLGTGVEFSADDGVVHVVREEERAVTAMQDTSYCGQLGSACTGACFGLLLFFGYIGLLIYNEGCTVKRAKDLDEGREVLVELTSSSIPKDMLLANQLVHTVGELNTSDILVDPVFGVGVAGGKSLKMSRLVEMYQWKETKTTSLHKTSYSYSKQWLNYIENSSNFHNSKYRNVNPTDFPFSELVLTADPIILGNEGIQLSPQAAGHLHWYEPVNSVSLDTVVDSSLRSRLELFESNGLYCHALASDGTYASSVTNDPAIGDARFTFLHMPADMISIVGIYLPNEEEDSAVVDAYTTSRGGTLLLVKRGNYTAQEMFQQNMFQQADGAITALAWILRFVGFFLMLFAVMITVPISLFKISLAWLAYHPAWSALILVTLGRVIVWLYFRAKKGNHDVVESNDNDDSIGQSDLRQEEFHANEVSDPNQPIIMPVGPKRNPEEGSSNDDGAAAAFAPAIRTTTTATKARAAALDVATAAAVPNTNDSAKNDPYLNAIPKQLAVNLVLSLLDRDVETTPVAADHFEFGQSDSHQEESHVNDVSEWNQPIIMPDRPKNNAESFPEEGFSGEDGTVALQAAAVSNTPKRRGKRSLNQTNPCSTKSAPWTNKVRRLDHSMVLAQQALGKRVTACYNFLPQVPASNRHMFDATASETLQKGTQQIETWLCMVETLIRQIKKEHKTERNNVPKTLSQPMKNQPITNFFTPKR